jgi:hypothetical protein
MRVRNPWKIIASGIVFAVIAQLINTVEAVFTMGYYTNPAYFPLWSSLMMPGQGPPGSEFYIAAIAANFAIGLIFASAYSMLEKAIPGKGTAKGVKYGTMLFLIAGIPFTLTTYLLLAVPTGLLLAWAAGALAIYVISGVAFARMITGSGKPA